MRLPRPSTAHIALALSLASCATAQFVYPPPLERPLSDYISGAASSALNFSEGDNMLGGWSTPGRLKSFMLYRCTHTPSSTPIYPSNSSFTSDQGSVARDGTWEQMPLYVGAESNFGNGFNPGNNPIWFHGGFFAPNATTGTLCWFELYPGTDTYSYENGAQRVATVNGAGDWYFATVPFTVHPKRPSGLTVTWKEDGTERGKPTRNNKGSSTSNGDSAAAIAQEFSSASSSSASTPESSEGSQVRSSGVGLVLGMSLLFLL